MIKHDKKNFLKYFSSLIVLLLIATTIILVTNHFSPEYNSLNTTDQTILFELDAYCKANKESSIWSGYTLEDKPILAINGTFGKAYLINPETEPGSLFAQKIAMPKGGSLQVYRLSVLTPQVFSMRFSIGNFNTIGKTYRLFGNEVYFTKYTEKESLEPQHSSTHYITLLSHEAFHYYMQDNWAGGSRFSEELSDADIDLIASEYDALAEIQAELAKDTPSKDTLLQYAKEYAAIMERRIAANPQYLNAELSMETAEGTAQYVCIKASKIAGYDYGMMCFDNTKDVLFSEVIPVLKSGRIEKSFLADRMPYETGALLCELLDVLDANGWQDSLNSQTSEHPITLYSVIKEYLATAD